MKLIVRAAILSLLWPAGASAQATGDGSRPERRERQDQAGDKQPVKGQPPPLFHKRRRGMYTRGDGPAVLDATPQSPPLEIDDPGVPDKGEYEVNLATLGDLSRDVNEFDLLLVDANYGLVIKAPGRDLPTQLKFEFTIAGAKETGRPFTAGLGAVKVGVKLNFYSDERRGVFASFYPQVEFAARGTDAIEKGLTAAGQTVTLPLLLEKEFSQVTMVINGAMHQPIHDPARTTTGSVSAGVG